ncbi:hypothetical protein J437_LFUL013414 [Ladona fulva]|uniref:RanBD1 domain-containing protein n=1 Tax=Ladona fulva TaxID=123851 RepID=A0A8K0P2I0_LADFU|nr:hypothetical protein J437_LFUL013414 [Ladona fulva]
MAEETTGKGDESVPLSPHNTSTDYDPHYEPIITLPEIHVNTFEENEEELIKLRAKLFRYDTGEAPPEWKERGTGEVKLLHNPDRRTVRVVMRRDKTLKICANHFVAPWMELKPNCGSDRAWVWSVPGDFADETPRNELLAIRFANAENALKWKDKFEEAKQLIADGPLLHDSDDEESDESEEEKEDSVSEDLGKLTIQEETKENSGENLEDRNAADPDVKPEQVKDAELDKEISQEKIELTEKSDVEISQEKNDLTENLGKEISKEKIEA